MNISTILALLSTDNTVIKSIVANATTSILPFSPFSELHTSTGASRKVTTMVEIKKRASVALRLLVNM